MCPRVVVVGVGANPNKGVVKVVGNVVVVVVDVMYPG